MPCHEQFMRNYLVTHNELKFYVNEGHGKLVFITSKRNEAKRFNFDEAKKLIDSIDHGDHYTIEHIYKGKELPKKLA